MAFKISEDISNAKHLEIQGPSVLLIEILVPESEEDKTFVKAGLLCENLQKSQGRAASGSAPPPLPVVALPATTSPGSRASPGELYRKENSGH